MKAPTKAKVLRGHKHMVAVTSKMTSPHLRETASDREMDGLSAIAAVAYQFTELFSTNSRVFRLQLKRLAADRRRRGEPVPTKQQIEDLVAAVHARRLALGAL